MSQAARVGSYLLAQLRALGAGHPLIHDARGQGLFLGVELRLPSGRTRPVDASTSLQLPARASARGAARPLVQLHQLPRAALPRCTCGLSSSGLQPAPMAAATPCATLSPGAVCSWLCTALMLCTPMGVLVGSDGPLHNVIKIKPPVRSAATARPFPVAHVPEKHSPHSLALPLVRVLLRVCLYLS